MKHRIAESASITSYISIIPVEGPSMFLSSITEYFQSLSPDITQWLNTIEESLHSPSQTFFLLRHMTAFAPHELISEHDANIISDLFPSFQALSTAVRTVEGRQLLEDYLGLTTARNVVDFWKSERIRD
jgi:hypothetical protein